MREVLSNSNILFVCLHSRPFSSTIFAWVCDEELDGHIYSCRGWTLRSHTDLPATRPLLEEYACVCVNMCTLAQPIISDYGCNLWVSVAKSRYINSEACCRARLVAGASWVKCWMDSLRSLRVEVNSDPSTRCAARLANEALGVQRGDLQYSCPLTKSKPTAGSRPKSGNRLWGYNLEVQKCPCVCVYVLAGNSYANWSHWFSFSFVYCCINQQYLFNHNEPHLLQSSASSVYAWFIFILPWTVHPYYSLFLWSQKLILDSIYWIGPNAGLTRNRGKEMMEKKCKKKSTN